MTSTEHRLEISTLGSSDGRFAEFWKACVSWFRRNRGRKEVVSLSGLDDRQLADMGLTRNDVRILSQGHLIDQHSDELARIALLRTMLMRTY